MQIPLLSGIYSDANADWRSSYPINCQIVPKDTGISKGYLLNAPGLSQFGSGAGASKGGINWNGLYYRVAGTAFERVNANGTVTNLGTVASGSVARFDYSFDYLAVVVGGSAYLYSTGGGLVQITDPDLGAPIDVIWIDGYFMFTDGTYMVVTELSNPFSIDPLKYGSSEADPDSVTGLQKMRNEAYAFNRYTVEVFDNVGGTGFPFTRVAGALVPKGCVAAQAKVISDQTIAWLGGGRNEPVSVYQLVGGSAQKIATREVEQRLLAYTDAQLAAAVMDCRADRMNQLVYLHLPNETLVYDANASQAAGEPVWFFLSGAPSGVAAYRARHFVWCYGNWLCGDTQDGRIGYLDDSVATQYEEVVGAQFDTQMLYNGGNGVIVWALELVGTVGRPAADEDPVVYMSYTDDGETWSQERTARMGAFNQTKQRVCWRQNGRMENFRGLRFRWANGAKIAWARLEAQIEPLSS